MTNPEAPSSELTPIMDVATSDAGTISPEAAAQYELQRLEEAREFAEELTSYLQPGMSKDAVASARANIESKVVGALMHEYKIGRSHGNSSTHAEQ
ncbi:hypothetical protein KBD20_02900 [Candidatus Saccharibacteria bacterium]|nr:hypothetical protein [Candidatus Saccharibacteria bacterium]